MCYASEYLDAGEGGPGRLNSGAAAAAEAAYKAEGVSPGAAGSDLPDRVTTELEFLYHLCRREERRGRRARAARRRAFVARWTPFCAGTRASGCRGSPRR